MLNWFKKNIGYFNLYERNVYKYCMTCKFSSLHNGNFKQLLSYVYTKFSKLVTHSIYLNYIEIPITTKCTLNCRYCSNLIQYYSNPYHIEGKDVINDIKRLCKVVEGIGMLRILGGEPLLHPELAKIINEISKEEKINKVQIVTNGTLLFSDDAIKILKGNKKLSVDISFYGNYSIKYKEFVGQLKKNHLVYCSNKNLVWTKQNDCTYKARKRNELEYVYAHCKLDCISMLNGKIHVCPRSSNGDDIGVLKAGKNDFVNIRQKGLIKNIRENIYILLNAKYVNACNYCDMYKFEQLEKCGAGEQAVKSETLKEMNEILKYNNSGDK